MKQLVVLLLSVLIMTACRKTVIDESSSISQAESVATNGIPVPVPAYKWTKFTLTYPNEYPYNWLHAPNLVMKVNENDVYLKFGSLLDHTTKLDNNTKRWLRHTTTNNGYMGFSVFSVGFQYLFSYNNKIYQGLMQGGPEFNEDAFGTLDPMTGVTDSKAPYPGTTTGDPVCFVVGDKGYIVSGFPRQIWEYNFASDQWTNKGSFPLGNRKEAVAFVHNNKVYMGLGYVTNTINGIQVKAYIKDWVEYDPLTNTSTAKANFPGAGRSHAKGFVVDNNIYMGIGRGVTGHFNDFWRYNPSTNKWSQQDDWPSIPESSEDNIATFSQGNTGYLVKAGLNEFWQFSRSGIMPL
jgi:hypothetical protein